MLIVNFVACEPKRRTTGERSQDVREIQRATMAEHPPVMTERDTEEGVVRDEALRRHLPQALMACRCRVDACDPQSIGGALLVIERRDHVETHAVEHERW